MEADPKITFSLFKHFLDLQNEQENDWEMLCFRKGEINQIAYNYQKNECDYGIVRIGVLKNVGKMTLNKLILSSFSEQLSLVSTQSINMLGTAVCAIILGAMLQSVGERGRPLLNVFEVLFDILMKIIKKFF